MEKQTALNALGLADNASEAEIAQAIAAKKQSIAEKQASAPTDALKVKFATMAKKLDEIEAVLAAGGDSADPQAPSPASSLPQEPSQQPNQPQSARAPLSQTKLADLPGMAPQDAAQVELQPGQILANRYEIKELIGQGGMGAVYRAHDKNTDREIALKLLLPSLLKNDSARERFLSEAKISQQLSHPNIVNVFDVQSEGDLFFLTMELLEGQDLNAVNQPTPVDEVKRIASELCDALSYAHEFTVHRDIKPENIWLDEKGRVKLMDFGIARVQSASQRTQTGAAMGTAYYMAPEQLQGRELDARADIYAVGVMLYEMLTGQIPAGRFESAITLRKEIGKGLNNTIDKALAVNPEQRFANAGEMKAALLSGKTGKAPKIPKAPKAANPHLSTGPNKLAIAAMVLLLVGGIGVAAQQGWLDALKPLDKELIAQQKADAAKLQGEIKTLKRRFDNAVRDLDRDISDAERDKNSKEEQRLQAWMDLAKRYLVDSTRYGELEGLESQADLHLRDEKQSAQAVAVLEQARDGYQALVDDFYAGENVSDLSPKVGALRKQWQGKQGSKVWPVSEKVEAQYQQARANEADGLLRDAEPKLTELKAGYTALIAANDDMAKVNQSLKQAQAAWQKLADSKKLTQVTEIEALKKEEQQHRDALKAAAELVAVTGAMEGLQGQITTYKELTNSVANLAQAEKNALSAKASYEKQRKGYPLDANATANKSGEQLVAAQAALKAKQWVAAGKGFAEAKAGYDSARSAESKVIASINQARAAQKKAQAAKASYEKVKEHDPDAATTAKASQALVAGDKALAGRQWNSALSRYVEAEKGLREAADLARASMAAASIAASITAAMVKIPSGTFRMGLAHSNHTPVHSVSVSSFFMQEHEVTWNQYQPCIDAGVCSSGGDAGWGKGNLPVLNVSWNDVQKYIGWLNQKTGKTFRLPSEAEWEYAARAGSTSDYSWGDSIGCVKARYGRGDGGPCGNRYKGPSPVKSYSPNRFGLYDMHGNVWEWVQDCWHDSYSGAPSNGSAWTSGGDCGRRVVRGGSWSNLRGYLVSGNRGRNSASDRTLTIGFRLVQDR
ncbi:SUMF1/EgtB/PvdO family nonheme iron enzyme [Alcanivorax sp. S6407]|uniref:bifunctional serine/threonine-protein kinase/formylglycine-generating enzyme family protein n=1 Tax=Alcanivorax sp. S6407 TaxID=2926424 RepID=UPI001FF5BBC9|nr:bifunctional serine/threonine-protein kinase/formylglycine-generating enzyme family protein [Alcanivorax sp. S6407]MCK0154924.1 SUMF1/EgtB/PvdO family nonheme iron enzyme [Alcanivorax sp. S6407]